MANVKNQMALYVFLAMGLFIGIALLVASANSIVGSTTRTSIVNEVIDLSAGRMAGGGMNASYQFQPAHTSSNSDWRANANGECDVNTVTIANQSGSVKTGTNYSYTPITGKVNITGTSLNGTNTNTSYITYSYCADTYIPGSANQSIMNLIILFGAIAILIFTVVVLIKNGGIYGLASKVKQVIGA